MQLEHRELSYLYGQAQDSTLLKLKVACISHQALSALLLLSQFKLTSSTFFSSTPISYLYHHFC